MEFALLKSWTVYPKLLEKAEHKGIDTGHLVDIMMESYEDFLIASLFSEK